MRLNDEQLTYLFNEYLRLYVIPGSRNHSPIFETRKGGAILTKRLRKICRDPKLMYVDDSSTLDLTELSFIAQEKLKKHPKVFIVGLNHWFTIKDIEVIASILENNFG